ncbi:MAG: energy transducer TonB [Bacteroidia bacterium]
MSANSLNISAGFGLEKQELTEEERKGRVIGIILTVTFAILLFLILLLIKIITPIPAIPPPDEMITLEIGLNMGTGGGAEVRAGGSEGNTGTPGMQDPSDAASAPPTNPPDNGAVTSNNPDNPAATNTNHTGNAQQPSTAMLDAIANFNKNKGKASVKIGGDGKGDPYTAGLGNGSGSDIGPGKGGDPGVDGPGGENGNDKTGNAKRYRSIVFAPQIVNPTQEEGKVVVTVTVNRQGKVTKAERSSAGSTTFNSTLVATAVQSAYNIKFNPDPQAPESLALSIDIIFTLK